LYQQQKLLGYVGGKALTALNKIAAEKGTVERLSNNILQKQEDLIKNYKFKLFDKGESNLLIDYENTKITNFLKTKKVLQKL
jgi:hypothetical protein